MATTTTVSTAPALGCSFWTRPSRCTDTADTVVDTPTGPVFACLECAEVDAELAVPAPAEAPF